MVVCVRVGAMGAGFAVGAMVVGAMEVGVVGVVVAC